MAAMSITPDTKDWTWVLERPCPECGFDAAAHDVSDLPELLEDTASAWSQVLGRGDATDRPRPGVWSALEYGCHVRDVHVLFAERVRLMLAEDVPTFANWDQDATAVERDYGSQDPAAVAAELVEAARTRGDALRLRHRCHARSPGAAVQRRRVHRRDPRPLPPARRRPPPPRRGGAGVTSETVRSYDRDAAAYVARTATVPDSVRAALERLAERARTGRARARDRLGRRS